MDEWNEELLEAIDIALATWDPQSSTKVFARSLVFELHAAGYTIAPLPENLTTEQVYAALKRDEQVYPYVRDGKMTLGDAWRETYRAALGIPPKEPSNER